MAEFVDVVVEYLDRFDKIIEYSTLPKEQQKKREKEVRLQLDEWLNVSTAESKLEYLILLQRVKNVPSPWNAFTSPSLGEAPPASVLIHDQSVVKEAVEPGSLLDDALGNIKNFFSEWSLEDYLLATGPAGWLTSIGWRVSEEVREQVKKASKSIGEVVSTGVWIAAAIGMVVLVGGGVAAVVWMKKQTRKDHEMPLYLREEQLSLPETTERSSIHEFARKS